MLGSEAAFFTYWETIFPACESRNSYQSVTTRMFAPACGNPEQLQFLVSAPLPEAETAFAPRDDSGVDSGALRAPVGLGALRDDSGALRPSRRLGRLRRPSCRFKGHYTCFTGYYTCFNGYCNTFPNYMYI